jgi:hypothetical protein
VAITKDPGTGQIYLLETLPGIKARRLKETTTDSVTMLYFDQKWRYRDDLDFQRRKLKEVLGQRYQDSYAEFLLFIDSSELEIEKLENVGEGSFGRVFSVPWKRKPVEVSVDHIEEQVGKVAVKIAHAHLEKGADAEAKFFAEVS